MLHTFLKPESGAINKSSDCGSRFARLRRSDFSNKDSQLLSFVFLSNEICRTLLICDAKHKICWGNECVVSALHDTPNMLMRSIARRTRTSVPYLMPFKYNSNTFDHSCA
ncbi:hypothetical protein QLX08_006634 [Tetragonisca angustula]|uniref:Uncharacterized protein n=1 Tax=Tetragonisca angustula TaxID=166442 RepID=A0AAW0ZTF0_9HYME